MSGAGPAWDYLVLTASNELQARAYEHQLQVRRDAGLLPGVREALVVADLEGRRIGSGGSTLYSLARILERERSGLDPGDFERILGKLRILIVHAGGDSRRLPAYGPCGKIFVPLPGAGPAAVPPTLFDRLVPSFLALPGGDRGQIVVAAGDALIQFDSSQVAFRSEGITVLGCYATPEEASRHGVYCASGDSVRLYLQKPSPEAQRAAGAISPLGQTLLDIGVMSLDARAAAVLLRTFGVTGSVFSAGAREQILRHGLDLYREICCGMGTDATLEHYIRSARSAGSTWSDAMLTAVFPALRELPFHIEQVPECRFLHFGSTRQLIESGLVLMRQDSQRPPVSSIVSMNNAVSGEGRISGSDSWVEACRISAPLELEGNNVVVGADIAEPAALPREACLDVLSGRDRDGSAVWFVRCYGVRDSFKESVGDGALFCGRPLGDWLSTVGVAFGDVWPGVEDVSRRSLWNARVFPAARAASDHLQWHWMYTPERAAGAQRQAYVSADRYSAAEIALLADQPAFHSRRLQLWTNAPAR